MSEEELEYWLMIIADQDTQELSSSPPKYGVGAAE